MRNEVIPKTIQKWIEKHPDLVESAHMENDEFDGYSNPCSIWLYLKPGYICTMTETHQVHEATVKDFLSSAGTIEKCECDECKSLLEKESCQN